MEANTTEPTNIKPKARRAPRKTRAQKEAENPRGPEARTPGEEPQAASVESVEAVEPVIEAPVHVHVPVPVVQPALSAAAETALNTRPRRVGPVVQRAHVPEADASYMAVSPGDVSPAGCAAFWRRVGPALDRTLAPEYIKPLVLAFEATVVATCSTEAAVDKYLPLCNNAYCLRRLGYASGMLHKELVIEFLAGHSGSFLVGTCEHVARSCGQMGWRVRELVVTHILGLYRAARAGIADVKAEEHRRIWAILGREIDRLGDARRALVKGVGENKATGLDPMLVTSWFEADEKILATWVENTIAKRAPRQMAAALTQAHVHVEG